MCTVAVVAGTRQFDTSVAVERAMDLFWERGYEATSMHDLTAALGLGRGSIYQAFGSKEGLYRAALAHYLDLMASAVVEAMNDGGDIRSVLRQAMLGRLDVALGDPKRRGCMLVNAACELLPRDAATGQTVRGVMTANKTAIEGAIAQAVARGEVAPSFDAASLADFLIACLSGLLVSTKAQAGRESVERSIDIALSTLEPVRPLRRP
jgi:TetR/AcrR family transcriptional repressor of nem operon